VLTLQILIDGFAISALYGLGAVGFTLIFGVSGVLNLSHGGIMVTAATVAWWAAERAGAYGGALAGLLSAMALAFVTYFAVVRPIQHALGFLAISGAVLFGLSRSSAGLILQACGQDPVEAGALGFNVAKHKLAAFCVSAFFSGLAGAMLVFYYGTASPGTFIDLAVGVQVIIAAVLGGRRTIVGAVLGAIFLVVAGEVLRPLGQLSTFVVSGFALVVILLVPAGFLGTLLYRRGSA